jgi:hypothetical protein
LLFSAAPIAAQSGGPYAIPSSTIGGGGQSFAIGGPYQLGSSTGQTDAGKLGGGAYTLYGGFWGPAPNAATSTPEATPDPIAFSVNPPAPNPFRALTSIAFSLPTESRVEISLHAVNGRLVRRLVSEVRGPGRHTVVWDGRDHNGRTLGAGVYFARLSAGAFVTTLRLVRMH